jgi:hypothetical protein
MWGFCFRVNQWAVERPVAVQGSSFKEAAHNSRKGPAQCGRHHNAAAAVTRADYGSDPMAGLRPGINTALER